jgi:hypothetical protein
VPEALTLKVTLAHRPTVRLAGWLVMLGGTSTVRVASGLLVADNPTESLTTTPNRRVVGWTLVNTSVAPVPNGMLVKALVLPSGAQQLDPSHETNEGAHHPELWS